MDEFNDSANKAALTTSAGVDRAESLFNRVLADYGDDSVAQLAGVHIAFENVSNLATKIIERPRLMSYLEQSTRYIPFDKKKASGQFRYHVPAELSNADQEIFRDAMDRLFLAYQEITTAIIARLLSDLGPGDIPPILRATTRAMGLDATRGLLPAATESNVGVYGSAQAMEQLVLHLYAHPLEEAKVLGETLHKQLKIMIPSLVIRLDRTERREPWVSYLGATRHLTLDLAELLPNTSVTAPGGQDGSVLEGELGSRVRLVEFDPHGEDKVSKAIVFESSNFSSYEIDYIYESMSGEQLDDLWTNYVGERLNRRHRPGRAFEKTSYKFEIEADYGAFRDLQRHRLLSCSWQLLGTDLGYFVSPILNDNEKKIYLDAIESVMSLYDILVERYGKRVAAYCVPMCFRIRFEIELNAREAMHLIELRSQPQGHPSYREVAQLIYLLIKDQAKHNRIAHSMTYVDLSQGVGSRQDSLQREAQKRGDSDNLVTN